MKEFQENNATLSPLKSVNHNEPTLFIEIERVVNLWEPPVATGKTY